MNRSYGFAKLGTWGAAALLAASLAACDNPSTAEEAAESEQARAERIAKLEQELKEEKALQEKETATLAETTKPAPKPASKPRAREPERIAYNDPPKPVICADCGTVSSIETVQAKGEGSGAGAIMGAIAGGVIGHQIGSGRGNDAATAAGAIGGGFAGHEIEKRVRSSTYYKVNVMMENGTTRTVNLNTTQGISVGSKVRVVGNDLQLRS